MDNRDEVATTPTVLNTKRPSLTGSINERVSTGTSANAAQTVGTITASQSIDYTMSEESSDDEGTNESIHTGN